MAEVKTSISIEEIKDRKIWIEEPSEKFKKQFEPEKLDLGVNLSFDPDIENDLLTVNLAIGYRYDNNEESKELFNSQFSFTFRITNLSDLISVDEDLVDIPDEIAINVLSISISTCRGLIAANTRGYFINKFYLPILSPKDLIGAFDKEKNSK